MIHTYLRRVKSAVWFLGRGLLYTNPRFLHQIHEKGNKKEGHYCFLGMVEEGKFIIDRRERA